MEVYLVKEEVKIIPVSKAVSKTKKFNGYIRDLQLPRKGKNPEGGGGDSFKSRDEDIRSLLTVTDLPVTLSSICSDASWQSGRFAERVEWILKTRSDDRFRGIKLELIISNEDGYFLVSSNSPEGAKLNVFKRLAEVFDLVDLKFSVQVSLCHLPTVNAAVSPESLVILKGDVGSPISVRIPPEMMKWWEQGTGFIYSKSSVTVTLWPKAVDFVYGRSDDNFVVHGLPNLVIGCKDGKVVACHQESFAIRSEVLRDKFVEMEKKGNGEGGPLKMEMGMSKAGVEAFLEHTYNNRMSGGLRGCGVALELFKAGREYGIWRLEEAMGEIMAGKGTSDFGYFSVEAALDLFLYARRRVGLKYLRDKAVRVLYNCSKTASEKMEESKEYLDLFENQPEVAAELSALYLQLS